MPDNEPIPPEDQPLGSEDPTSAGQPLEIGDPNATQAEADEGGFAAPAAAPIPAPQEPGTEAEGIEEATAEVTQEAPLLEGLPEPVEDVPQVPAFPIDVKPKSDVYTLMLILCFVTFVTVTILAGNEAYDHYDVQFWVFDKKGEEEPPPEEAPADTGAPAAPGAPATPPPATPPPATPGGG